jgi:hypothetical protein
MTNIPNVVDPKPISATIESLAWMAGGWYGTVNGDPVDEHWSTPAGGAMMGMFRWLKNGKVYLYELLAIEADADGLVLRLKHFDRGLNSWEGKGQAVAYPLVQVGDQEAAFERGGAYRSTRFVYKRTGERTLTVITEERKGDEVERNEFSYTHAQVI